jgi:hypothetical protein
MRRYLSHTVDCVIVVLYFVQPIEQRLGVVASFTFIFAASIALLTNARRVEVFGAAAA